MNFRLKMLPFDCPAAIPDFFTTGREVGAVLPWGFMELKPFQMEGSIYFPEFQLG